ncbi:hypothetical protein ACWGR4_39945 [Embleya sp. NPDC055664]
MTEPAVDQSVLDDFMRQFVHDHAPDVLHAVAASGDSLLVAQAALPGRIRPDEASQAAWLANAEKIASSAPGALLMQDYSADLMGLGPVSVLMSQAEHGLLLTMGNTAPGPDGQVHPSALIVATTWNADVGGLIRAMHALMERVGPSLTPLARGRGLQPQPARMPAPSRVF